METNPSYHDAVNDWLRIPEMIEEAIAGFSAAELDLSAGSDAMSPRETVHHLVEANIVASSMIIAALGSSGCTFDWSWLYPNTAWVKRVNYGTAPIDPALATLRGLCQHISNIVRAKDNALQCEVRLFDSPGAETYSMTVEAILRHEVDHAEEHLLEIRKL